MGRSRSLGAHCLSGALAIAVAAFIPVAGHGADLSAPEAFSLKDAPDDGYGVHGGGNNHSTIPAGVSGAAMVGAGEGMLMYMPMYMSMQGTYAGTDKISTPAILATPHSGMGAYLSVVPNSMDVQMHMLGAEYGVTNYFNVMVMGNYVDKSMTMTSYAEPMGGNPAMGRTLLGAKTNETDGLADVTVSGLVRLYEDGVNHIHVNLGLSVPTGDITEQATMISPMGMHMPMTMRAMYGMQIGTGTVDFLPGVTYTANKDLWSWGAAYRGRIALDDNEQGYRWGDLHEVTGWLGYTFIPGVTATARVAGSTQGKIEGSDPLIAGPMQGAVPGYYGGQRVDLFGGIEIAGHRFGLGDTRLAIEAGAPVYQDLNGPQLGQDWQLNASLGVRF
ncbi:MAG: alpha-amylase [Rhodomicrobium sp.]